MTKEYTGDCNAMEGSVGASGDAACQNDNDAGGGGGITSSKTANCALNSQNDTLVQLVAQVESMKADLSNEWSQESWTARQNLQDLYTKIILLDLEYALDKKIEQDLWNTVFKQPITSLQMKLSDKKNPKRAEVQMNLSNLLEHSSGFYLQLLQEICATFGIDLQCRMYLPSSFFLDTNINSIIRKAFGRHLPKRGSCACICQHCLVHLGDLARYRQQAEQARTYYHWAMVVVPTSGHPYNQLAILESQKGNLLSTVFYYALAMACKTPFPAATTNFEKLLGRIKKDPLPSTARLGQQELTTCFLHYHGVIHLSQGAPELSRARIAWERFSRQFASQLSPVCHFDWRELVQMVAIQLFALTGAGGTRETTLSETIESLVTSLVSLVECFSHCLIQLQEDKLPRSPILPALVLLCSWLGSNWTTLKGQSTSSALMTVSSMPNFVRLLNNLQKMEATPFDIDKSQLEKSLNLPEDNLLQGFQPLISILTTANSVGRTSESNSEVCTSSEGQDETKSTSSDTCGDLDQDKAVFRLRLLRLMDAARSLVRHKLICHQQNQFSLLPQPSSHASPNSSAQAVNPSLALTNTTTAGAGIGVPCANSSRPNGPLSSPVAARNAVNIAMQSIIQQKQQQQLQQQKLQHPDVKQQNLQQAQSANKQQAAGSSLTKQSQPGLLFSAEIARSIQEHAAQVAKSEASVRGGSVSGAAPASHDGRRTPSGATPVVAASTSNVSGAPSSVSSSANERRYLYNQNREQFQKDLPPRFARKAAAAAMAGGGGLLGHESSLLSSDQSSIGSNSSSSILSAVQRQPSAEQQPNSLPLARKESEPLYPTVWYSPPYYMQPTVGSTTPSQEDSIQNNVSANGGSTGLRSLGQPVAGSRTLMEVPSGDASAAFPQFGGNSAPGSGGGNAGPGAGMAPVAAAGGVSMFGGLMGGPGPQGQGSAGPPMSMQVAAAVAGRNPLLTHPTTTVQSSNSHVNPNQVASLFPPPPRFPIHRHQPTADQQQPQQQSSQNSPPHSSQSSQQLHPHSGASMNATGWLPDGNKMQPHPPSLMSGASRPLPPPVGTRLPGPHGPRAHSAQQQHQRQNVAGTAPPGSGISGNGGGDSVDPVSRRLLSGNVQSLWASPLENLLQQQQRHGGIGTGATSAPGSAQFRFGGPTPQQSRSGAT